MSISETIVIYGGAVKALGDLKVGGYLVRFSDPDDTDLEGEYFTPDTDFGLPEPVPLYGTVYYQHGLDKVLKKVRLGLAEHKMDDFGIWAEVQLKMREGYEKHIQFIYEMSRAGKLGWSSGTAGHLTEREKHGKAMWIKSWPLGLDDTLTPIPADPNNAAVSLKSWQPVATPFTLADRLGLLGAEVKEITSDLRGLLEQDRPLNAVKRQELTKLSEMFSGMDDVRHELDEVLNAPTSARLAGPRLISHQLAEARKRLQARNILEE